MTQLGIEPRTFLYRGGPLSFWTGQIQWPKFPSVLNLVQSLSFLTLKYSISMHLHSTFHEICTIHECIHIVRTPKCREISQKVMAQPGFEPGTFLFRGCSNH